MRTDLQRLLEARHHAPFEVLGPRRWNGQARLRLLLPAAVSARVVNGPELTSVAPMLYEWRGPGSALPEHYRISWRDAGGREHEELDPYAFPVEPDARALAAFATASQEDLPGLLGATALTVDGIDGVRFSVWAPHAERVSVVGPFNHWDGRRHPMQVQGASGVWCLFIPGMTAPFVYHYEIRHRDSGCVVVKSDPMAHAFATAPRPVSRFTAASSFIWDDGDWMAHRACWDWRQAPIAVYEAHLTSWRQVPDGRSPLRAHAEPLADHLASLAFTHVELLPVMEHPFGGSWGYQTLGYFAPAQRYGSADDLRYFVDVMHRRGIGVLLDWTPAHFPRDAHGLAWFDGEPLYEYADPRLGVHPDWDTAVFDYGRGEVQSFLISSALYWLEQFHVDGLRVDAVASMLYRDYSRSAGAWTPNRHGGRENLEAIEFLRRLNDAVARRCPGALMIAEESTSWPMVTRSTAVGGLGFSLKWNMGWMHDTLDYLRLDPVYRAYHHDKLTFGMLYADSERFMLSFSHDEVVHGKASLLHKLHGDDWQKFATLRLLYCYLYSFPGKKLLFMGAELAMRREWSHERALDWELLAHAPHRGVQRLVADLNRLYRCETALQRDHAADGFQWIDCHDHAHSIVTYLRTDGTETLVIVANFTPVVRHGYRIGVPKAGCYVELLNSDSHHYGGSNVGNGGRIESRPQSWMGRPACVELTLPPLAVLILARRPPSSGMRSPTATSGGDTPPHVVEPPEARGPRRPEAPGNHLGSIGTGVATNAPDTSPPTWRVS